MARRKNRRSAISKEKRYYKRLRGDYKDSYKAIRKERNSIKQNKKRLKSTKKTDYNRIKFPKELDIYDYHNTRNSLKSCNDIFGKGKYILLDFSVVELLSASVGAYLLSTVLKALSMGKVIRCKNPKDEKSKAVLQKIGLFKIIGKNEPLAEAQVNNYPDIERWFVYRSSKFNSQELYECVHEFTTSHIDKDSKEMPNEHRKSIEKNIKELIGNTIEHAYPKGYTLDRHFILFAKYEDDYLDLIISDSGLTIPITYVKYHRENAILKEYLKKGIKSDTTLIEMAVKKDISGTNLDGRGHGLNRAESMIKEYGGAMLIYSKKGYFLNKNNRAGFRHFKLALPIHGTVVNLSLPLESLT